MKLDTTETPANGETSTAQLVLLLVEDNPGDAEFVSELLKSFPNESYQIILAPLLSEATKALRSQPVDIVVLDLRLPDSSGVDAVKGVRETAHEVPIIVLTGTEDDTMAFECINAGAQDYLTKNEIRAQTLRRAIGYALGRTREAQVKALQRTLDSYRALSSSTQKTLVTAAIAGSGAIATRNPQTFGRILNAYVVLLEPYLSGQTDRIAPPRSNMEEIVTMIGDMTGGPRDLLDVHLAALERVNSGRYGPRSQYVVIEGRLLALEMMGLLVDYYRVGLRSSGSLNGVRPW